ncbi:MAG TPA: GH116 family glycosyl hydrolase [Phycisphaerae bacterium]|nr:GH116 family glycosyl hydrolase [Phycisphaerae bacterium]
MEPRQPGNQSMPRRDFLKKSVATAGAIGAAGSIESLPASAQNAPGAPAPVGCKIHARKQERAYNGPYTGLYLDRVAFPLGGIGAGMICLEGTGALSHLSIRNKPDIFNEPCTFAAICIKGRPNTARVVEGPLRTWKLFGTSGSGNGGGRSRTFGLPRFAEAVFEARFPFGMITLTDPSLPVKVEIAGWSPFEPGDPDSASLPMAGIEYRFVNTSDKPVEAVFSFNTKNFMEVENPCVRSCDRGFVLCDTGNDKNPWNEGAFHASVTDPAAKVSCRWFRGGWFDPLSIAWKAVQDGICEDQSPYDSGKPSPGASLFVPLRLAAGQDKTVTLQLSWYVGKTSLRVGKDPESLPEEYKNNFYVPWYAGRFKGIDDVAAYWQEHYDKLRNRSKRFSDCLYDSTLPPEVTEAVAANLTILKSPTALRQSDGRFWGWEGCSDGSGCCHGTCTHVWNYAQAVCHLFPSLERSLRETEFKVSQDEKGHQAFRASLPIRPTKHDFHAASDGQLGGIMKVYREWRTCGDTDWLRGLWPKVKQSLGYCIETWDPRHKGVLEEPHHNTYDIEFWGPNGMCSSFYLGALAAAIKMGKALGDDVTLYEHLLANGKKFLEEQLYNGEYFIQKIQWKGLNAPDPTLDSKEPPEAAALIAKEGPKYQYGEGCISDGVLGLWLAAVCGVGDVLDRDKVISHLRSIYKYNLKHDLSAHANPQRPTYAAGNEGGLLLCTWPRGGDLSLPFVYSNEVWTGIEYQVASHLLLMGCVDEGLDIVRVCRDRYDGRVRNPFNEYECGHWYARAMSSYGLLQGLAGARYDAVEKTLYLSPRIKGDFRSFFATAGGYGTVGVKDGKPFFDVKHGKVDISAIKYSVKA